MWYSFFWNSIIFLILVTAMILYGLGDDRNDKKDDRNEKK